MTCSGLAPQFVIDLVRNDQITLEELIAWKPSRLMISPGPGDPTTAGISVAALQHFAGRVPVLGVCLGHQGLAAAFGGEIVRAKSLMHGKTSPILHNGKDLFRDLPQNFPATRYHSLLVERSSFPAELEITAETAEGEVMGLRHRTLPIWGVQFHPESIATVNGVKILQNFMELN